ncbi:hypothetical protein, conserved [Angomonas deanei]|uniref:Uncharacterized protein n=1 Tax=Angomonas deanei TaxID=59799 RepID=A0A7G2CQ34_9TRYP|nr:hypothetical protein, conserved [Angomonas deanei]
MKEPSDGGVDALRRQVEEQEAYVQMLEQRKVLRDDLLQQVRSALNTDLPKDYYEIEATANAFLRLLESVRSSDVVPVEEEPAVPEDVTIEALIGVETEEKKKNKKRKKKPIEADAEKAVEKAPLSKREQQEEADKTLMFEVLDQLHFDPMNTDNMTDPDWLNAEEEKEESYTDDFEEVGTADEVSLSLAEDTDVDSSSESEEGDK